MMRHRAGWLTEAANVFVVTAVLAIFAGLLVGELLRPELAAQTYEHLRRSALYVELPNLGNAADTNYVSTTPYALPAGTLARDGDALDVDFVFTFNAAVSTKSYLCNIGYSAFSVSTGFTGGVLFISSGTSSASNTVIGRARITRTSATASASWAQNTWANSATTQGANWATGVVTWGSANNILCAVKDGTGNAAAVTINALRIHLDPAP